MAIEQNIVNEVSDIRDRVTRVESRTEVFETIIQSHQQLLNKLIWGLMVLIGGLVGKETLVGIGKINSTPMEYIQLGLTGYLFGGLSFHLIFRALQDKNISKLALISGVMVLITAFLRIDQGFSIITNKSNILVTVPFVIAGVLALIAAFRLKIE